MVDKENIRGGNLEWHDDMPYSSTFGDHYYSKADGRAECAHVFLGGNDLPARWADKNTFTIAELGFGTGLNFVETRRQWQSCRQPDQGLRFISFERYPLAPSEMNKALSVWPELSVIADELTAAWPDQASGMVRCVFADGVTLEVHIGIALDTVSAWSSQADAWFLDGFAPSRNEDMWSEQLMNAVFERTAHQGTFATYTAAGWVRRNLSAAGFVVQKVQGFAGKRDMTIGKKPSSD